MDNWQYTGYVYLQESTSQVVGNIIMSGFVVPMQGKKLAKFGASYAGESAGYVGPLVFIPTFDNNGNLKKVKLYQPKVGTILYSAWTPIDDDPIGERYPGTDVQGAAASGLSMEWVQSDTVPQEVLDCFQVISYATASGFICPSSSNQ